MVVNIAIKGGLGNQLFQYALGNFLQQEYQAAVFYDTLPLNADEKNLTKRYFLLDRLFKDLKFTTEKTHHIFYAQNNSAPVKWYKKLFRLLNGYYYVPETNPQSLVLKNNATYYFDGHWQHADIAKRAADSINAQAASILEKNAYAKLIKNSGESVAIHIRRGDYVNNAFISDYHGSCDLKYYQRAMSHIETKIRVGSYFIFSDDLPWAKQNISSTHPLVFVEGNDQQPVGDLLLMKSCRHQVISNSSFSCWASYLNTYAGKIVIAPLNWTKKEKTKNLPLSEPAWILI